MSSFFFFFFFNDTATTEIYTLSLHDALPISCSARRCCPSGRGARRRAARRAAARWRSEEHTSELQSHVNLVCRLLLEKKKTHIIHANRLKTTEKKEYTLIYHSVISSSCLYLRIFLFFFFFNDTATTEIYTLSLHDALPTSSSGALMPVSSSCSRCIRSSKHARLPA